MRPPLVVLPCLLLLAGLLAGVAPPGGVAPAAAGREAAGSAAAITLRVGVVARDLDHPWEVARLSSGHLLVTQRARRTLTRIDPATGGKRNLTFPSSSVWAMGETGLLGLAVDPQYSQNRRIYTCSGWRLANGGHDIRVIAWTLTPGPEAATFRRTLVSGIPSASTGRHGGCRLLVAQDGSLMIGTGDAAVGTNPQNLASFGGKVLRVNRMTGAPWPKNPWYSGTGKRRYVYTYGHRNVQGLAQRPGGSLWSVEHGTDRDDEINLLRSGRNFGWHPVPGYNESRPMTDGSLPGTQYAARWRSGYPTIAPSGATFVTGSQWGSYRGSLAVAVLKEQRLMFVQFDSAGRLLWTRAPSALQRYGRLRAVTAVGQSLFVTTDNGDGNDVVLRVMPSS